MNTLMLPRPLLNAPPAPTTAALAALAAPAAPDLTCLHPVAVALASSINQAINRPASAPAPSRSCSVWSCCVLPPACSGPRPATPHTCSPQRLTHFMSLPPSASSRYDFCLTHGTPSTLRILAARIAPRLRHYRHQHHHCRSRRLALSPAASA